MLSNRRPATVTFLFLVVFAAWFVSDRYVSVAFYRLNVGEGVELALGVLIHFAFVAVIGASLFRSWRGRSGEWLTITAAIGLLLLAEVAWRFIIAPLPMNGFKLAASVMDVGTPAVALLGVSAVIAEWRTFVQREKRGTAAPA